jgi:hypothetical protein
MSSPVDRFVRHRACVAPAVDRPTRVGGFAIVQSRGGRLERTSATAALPGRREGAAARGMP